MYSFQSHLEWNTDQASFYIVVMSTSSSLVRSIKAYNLLYRCGDSVDRVVYILLTVQSQ
jgi:hypothetical protein